MTNKENIAAGFALQKRICERYNLEINEKKRKVFNSFGYNNVDRLDRLIDNIFKEIHWKPKKCVEYIGKNEQGTINYLLTWNKTMSIRMAKKSAPPRIVGQPGFELINYYFSDIFGKKVTTQNEIKELFMNTNVLKDVIPIMLKYLLRCDYNVFVCENDKINIIRKLKQDIVLDESKISVTMSPEYPSIRYGGISIAQIAYYDTPTYVFRINIKNINKFIQVVSKVTNNTERGKLGTATEKAICNIYGIKNKLSYRNTELVNRLVPYIKESMALKDIQPDYYAGDIRGEEKIIKSIIERTGNSKNDLVKYITGFGSNACSAVDFYAKRKSLSVKTTRNTNFLVCPDTIGQPSATSCRIFFSKVFKNFDSDITPKKFIDIIMDKEKLVLLIEKYVEYIYECDYLFWVKYIPSKDSYEIKILDREIEGKKAIKYKWNKDYFNYMHSKEEFVNQTTTTSHCHGTNQLNYADVRLGQFDIFMRDNRYIYEFRFNLKNLIDITNTQ